MRRLTLLALLLPLLAAGPAQASWSIAALMNLMAGVESARARFVEERQMTILDQSLVTEGTLSYRAPDHLMRQDLVPRAALYTLNGDRLTIRNDRGERQISLADEPLLRASIAPFRAIMAGDVAALEESFELDLEGGEAAWTLHLTPKAAALQALVQTIRVAGSAAAIREIEVTEQGGDTALMRLSDFAS